MSETRRAWKQPISALYLLLVSTAIVAVGALSPAMPSHGQALSNGQSPGEWCPSGTESFDVLILMDESRSLRRTDPDRQRIEAVENLIESLEEEVSEELRVRVALASFGTEFEIRQGFTDLAQESADQLMTQVRSFTEDDWSTDYVLAISGAATLDWSAECNKVVWYTDGEHNLTDAPKGGAESMAPRAYDALERELDSASIGSAVEGLLIPAVCGTDGVGGIAAGYGDLSDRMASLDVQVEFALYYFGDLEEGDSKTLIAMMEVGECGDGVYLTKQVLDPDERQKIRPPTPTTTTGSTTTTSTLPPPPPPICEGLPEPYLPGGRDIVWSGVLPDGIASAFVGSVIVRAAGNQAELSSEYSSQTLAEDGGRLQLSLDFSDVVFSSVPRSLVAVRGQRIDEACVSFVLETPSLEARILTSPIFPDTRDIRMQIRIDGNPLAADDEKYLNLSIDGEDVARPEAVGGGQFRIPRQRVVGEHEFEVRLESKHAKSAEDGGTFIVTLKPDGPILKLDRAALGPVAATEFTIPIVIDDVDREGQIRLLPVSPILGTDEEEVGVEVRFPNGRSVWSSDTPKPDALTVILSGSVQTPDNHVLHVDYESDPSADGDTRTIRLAVPVDIDHPRNLVIEAIIVAGLLALLLLVIWVWLFGINRIAGRIRRPRRIRWSRFRVSEEWALAADLSSEGHRRVKHSPSRLEAGRLQAKRKSSLLAWRFPHVELAMGGSRRFIGMIGEGFDALEVSGRSARLLSESWLRRSVVLVDVSKGPPFEGVVMAPIDPSWPAEEQLTEHVREALEHLQRPEQLEPDQK